MELMECMLARRSGRSYTMEPVPQEALDEIIAAGLLAPSSRNLKSTELIRITNRETLTALASAKAQGAGMLANATAAIAVIGDSVKSDAWIEDGSIALTQMMLRAAELGIANCWVQIRNRYSAIDGDKGKIPASEICKKLLKLPENYSILAILSLGMPDKELPAHTLAEADLAKVHTENF